LSRARTHRNPLRETWTFIVDGDSRNCGDMVMPAIAADAKKTGAAFYWHLGDLRRIEGQDEDWLFEQKNAGRPTPTMDEYLSVAWDDFAAHQIAAFGDIPFFLGIGNHEVVKPKTEAAYLSQFHDQLNIPQIKDQRLHDDPADTQVHTWFHWVQGGVDFINMDNAVKSSFGAEQMKWFNALLTRDEQDKSIKSIVLGMHEALPWSKSADHSMCQSNSGIAEGDAVYHRMLEAQAMGKKVYILASHSHYYVANLFDTPHWRDKKNGVVLPGWIVGTAGAERYPLGNGVKPGPDARQHIYGYMTGTVAKDGSIQFSFVQFTEDDLQKVRTKDFTADDVHWCYVNNPTTLRPPPDRSCEDTAAAAKK
jgi:hypothetical protein